MRKSDKTWFSIVVFPLIVLLVLVSAACAATAPQELEIPVKLTAGQLDPGTIRVGQNDTITLKIESDQPGVLHLHGYDQVHEVKSGEVTDFVFFADASGRFRIAFHSAEADPIIHEESGHGEVFESEVLYPGDAFSIVVTPELAGKVISYHSHLHPEVIGSVRVAADAPAADTVTVEIRDGETDFSEVVVGPGTTIIWTNHSSETQLLASGVHVEIVEDSHVEPGHSHEESSEVEEIDVGFLEVQPR